MNCSTIFNRLSGFRSLGFLAALAGLSIFWACHLNEADSKDFFDLKIDDATAQCDSLLVLLENEDGEVLDTLFNDTLVSASQLSKLDAGKYPGGKARVRILGRKDRAVCIEQTRDFDDKGGQVVIDTLLLPGTLPLSVALSESLIEISVGDASVEITATLAPAFADQLFDWSVDDATVANLDYPDGPNGGRILVIPQKNGVATIQVRAHNDPSKTAELVVRVGSVDGKSISVVPESLSLFLGGPDTLLSAKVSPDGTEETILWSSDDVKIAAVDGNGKVKPIGAGSTTIKARFGGATTSVAVKVKRDVPVLTIASKSGAAINVPITFSPKATQAFGSIVLFQWDLAGDGEWDDSLSGPFLGTSVDLPPQTFAYSKQGHYTARFLVQDSEGNEAAASVEIDIGDQPPEILSKSADTLISIKDSIPLIANAKDLEGKVVWMGWDYENDGKFDDSAEGDQAALQLKGGHRYPKVGVFSAVLRVEDEGGKVRTDSVKVTVELFPPIANAGKDTTVVAGTPVRFRVLGEDSLGSITKRELKVGSGPFLSLSASDTSITLPGDSGSVVCVARITDDDGNSDEDTMVVTIKVPTLSNTDLAALTPSAGALAPTFRPVTLLYTLQVPYADSQITMTASTFDPKAEIAINGKPVASGDPSDPVDIKVGTTQDVFKIVVTAQDGTQKTHAVAVTRLPSNDTRLSQLVPSGFSLKPAFASALLEYADTVASAVTSVSLKPTAGHPAAKVTVNDSVVVSGASSKPVPLIVGDNLIKIEVTAQDGKTKAVYNVKVVRRAKLILLRLLQEGTPEQIDSLEAPLGTTVTLSAKDTVGFHFQKWRITAGSGTLQDSLANPGKLILKSASVRVQAMFPINIYRVRTGFAGFEGGKFSVDSALVKHGGDTTFTITPLTGYRLLGLTDNGKEVKTDGPQFGARTYTLKGVVGNHLLEATFLKTYSIKVTSSTGGTVSPIGTTEVDSNSTFDLSMTATSIHFWVSAFTDNGADSLGFVAGDRMATSKYSIMNISSNHDLAVTFALRTFNLTVVGKKVSVCRTGNLCLTLCRIGEVCPPPPDSLTTTVEFGVDYTIRTDTTGVGPFSTWCGSPTMVTNANPGTVNLTAADGKYTAKYNGATCLVRCCPGNCCVIGDPIIKDPVILEPIGSTLAPAASRYEPMLIMQSKETNSN